MENPLGLSDEEFLNLNSPADAGATSAAAATETTATETPAADTATETPAATETTPAAATTETTATETPATETQTEDDKTSATTVTATPAAATPTAPVTTTPAKEQGKTDATTTPTTSEAGKKDGTTAETKPVETTPDYKAVYDKLMAPLHANGKTIEIKSPEEAIQLMQMGANYTKKMQAITPYRKHLQMLENNGLLDENKLSFLIDLDKKNPEAIKKLVKESGIDPMELDGPNTKTNYFEGNHKVSDDEVNFKTAVEDVKSNPHGVETLQAINTWDQVSKEVLWKQPEIMEVIRTQQANGIYAQITGEIERRRTLGTIPANMPFLSAYKTVGDDFAAAGKFVATTPVTRTQETVAATPVATRVATPKPQAVNGERVSAASSVRSTPRTTGKIVNPLSMNDDDFLKAMADRL